MRARTVRTRYEKRRWGAGALAVLIASVLALFSTTISASLMDEKLNLERSIQERAEHLVEKIIGSKNMVVLVNVELESESAPGQGAGYTGTNFTEQEYLPGITYSNIPVQTGDKATTIKRIKVLVTVDEAISTTVAEQVKKELFEVLGLNAVRNDAVAVKKIPFAKEPSKGWKDYVGAFSVQIYWLIALILFTIFLFGPLRSFFRSIASTKVNIDASSLKPGDLASAVGGALGMPKLTLSLEKEGEHASKHFTFVNEMNVQNLVFLMKGESKEKVAVALNFLPPGYASEVFSALDPETQSFVAETLTEKKLLQQTDVFMVEEEVKQRIDYLTGGVEHFLNLMEHLDVRAQETIMGRLEKERPSVARRVRNAMFMFKDVLLLDKPALLKLVRTAQGKNLSFATALSKAAPELKDKVMQALPEGAQAILAEEIRLTGDVSEVRVSEEQRAIARLGRLLEKAGEISINRGGLAGGATAALGSGEGEHQSEETGKEIVEAEALPTPASAASETPSTTVPAPVENVVKKDTEPIVDPVGEIGQNGFFVDVEDVIKKKHDIIAASQESHEQEQLQTMPVNEGNREELNDRITADAVPSSLEKEVELKDKEKEEFSFAAGMDERRKEKDGDIIEFPRMDTVQERREPSISNENKDIIAEAAAVQTSENEAGLESRETEARPIVSITASENPKGTSDDVIELPKSDNVEHETAFSAKENEDKQENIERGRVAVETVSKAAVENDIQENGQAEERQFMAVGEQSSIETDTDNTVKPGESNGDQGNETDLGSFWLKRLSESHKDDQVS